MDKAYDKFDVEIKSVQLLFARAGNMSLSFQDLEIRLSSFACVCMCIDADDILDMYPVGHLRKSNEPITANPCHSYKQRLKICLFILGYIAPF